jgi:hypothetical protein
MRENARARELDVPAVASSDGRRSCFESASVPGRRRVPSIVTVETVIDIRRLGDAPREPSERTSKRLAFLALPLS